MKSHGVMNWRSKVALSLTDVISRSEPTPRAHRVCSQPDIVMLKLY